MRRAASCRYPAFPREENSLPPYSALSRSRPLPAQKVELTQITLGFDFDTPITTPSGQLKLNGGISSIYSSVKGGRASFEGVRGRIELGVEKNLGNAGKLRLNTFYDGIGSDYSSHGINIDLRLQF